mgnify:CR=1 FL=1
MSDYSQCYSEFDDSRRGENEKGTGFSNFQRYTG